MSDFRKAINRLCKDFGGDWGKDERDTLNEITLAPSKWRVIIEQPSETTQWNCPVCVIEFVLSFDRVTELDNVAEDWEPLWWCCDNTSSYSFRALREVEDGSLWYLIADQNVVSRIEREVTNAPWNTV